MITADQEILPMSLCESEVSIPEAIARISTISNREGKVKMSEENKVNYQLPC